MLEAVVAKKVIDKIMSRGATFADLFVESRDVFTLKVLNGEVDSIRSGLHFGIGVRILQGTQVLYGYTNSQKESDLMRVVDELFLGKKINGPEVNFPQNNTIPKHLEDFDNSLSLEQKLQYLKNIHKGAKEYSSKISQVTLNLNQTLQHVEIFNSEGLRVSEERPYTRLNLIAMAQDGNEQATGTHNPGHTEGLTLFDRYNPQKMGELISQQAVTVLGAKGCPAGEMPVLIGPGFGGVIFHEACGHLLETTSVEKKASVFHDKMNQKIASSCVTAIDNGHNPQAWGSIKYDDEGLKTKETRLIENGILRSFLVDRVGSLKTGLEVTGSGRRESYKYPPASRMRNTYIAPGDASFDEMLASMDNGIYAKTLGGGSVMPGTGEFNFAVLEGYIVKNGKIGEAVKGATLIGKGPEVLQKISMVGRDLELAAGMCGSVSGSVPVCVGQPTLKVDSILVGGQS